MLRHAIVEFPQSGRCLCGTVEFRVTEDPLTLYFCHCTDCQTQSGASFAISMIVRDEALEIVRGTPVKIEVELGDGRVRHFLGCSKCYVRISGASSVTGLAVVEPGTLDDTSWIRPIGHIWARSAQPWVVFEDDDVVFQRQPVGDEPLELVRAWKSRHAT